MRPTDETDDVACAFVCAFALLGFWCLAARREGVVNSFAPSFRGFRASHEIGIVVASCPSLLRLHGLSSLESDGFSRPVTPEMPRSSRFVTRSWFFSVRSGGRDSMTQTAPSSVFSVQRWIGPGDTIRF